MTEATGVMAKVKAIVRGAAVLFIFFVGAAVAIWAVDENDTPYFVLFPVWLHLGFFISFFIAWAAVVLWYWDKKRD